jgi:hypothetical protein
MYPDLTPLQTSPLQGERLKTLIFRLLLPLLVGERGWVGEVLRTHVKIYVVKFIMVGEMFSLT